MFQRMEPSRRLLVSFGLSTLCSFPLFVPLASPRHLAVFHLGGSVVPLFLPQLLYFGVFWLAADLLLRSGVRRPRVRFLFWILVLCSLPWFGTKAVAVALGRIVPASITAALLLLSIVCFAFFMVILGRRRYTRLIPFVRATEALFTLIAWSGVVLLVQVLWFFFAARHLNTQPNSRGWTVAKLERPLPAAHPRTIWIILDELGYSQTYEDRFPGLTLPAFDRLRSQSVLFTHVVPAGVRTERVVPALISGLPVQRISSSADGNRLTMIGPKGLAHSFDARQTIFFDAQRAGFHPGLAGWYNPYCRLLTGVLDRCIWVPHHDTLPGGFRTDTSLGQNLTAPVLSGVRFVGRLLAPQYSTIWTDRKASDEHIAEFRDLAADAFNLLDDDSIDFLFLHMAVPHPEGIYDRRENSVTDSGNSSYIDNLALADRFLKQVEDHLRERGEWDSSTLVVMGDHSWRTRELWRQLPGWTVEDELASHGGQFDSRPVYLVKLPNEKYAAQVDSSFDALRTRQLVSGLLNGYLKTTSELKAWAESPGPEPTYR